MARKRKGKKIVFHDKPFLGLLSTTLKVYTSPGAPIVAIDEFQGIKNYFDLKRKRQPFLLDALYEHYDIDRKHLTEVEAAESLILEMAVNFIPGFNAEIFPLSDLLDKTERLRLFLYADMYALKRLRGLTEMEAVNILLSESAYRERYGGYRAISLVQRLKEKPTEKMLSFLGGKLDEERLSFDLAIEREALLPTIQSSTSYS